MAGDVIKKVDNKPVLKILNRSKRYSKTWTYPKEPSWIYCVRSDRSILLFLRLIETEEHGNKS